MSSVSSTSYSSLVNSLLSNSSSNSNSDITTEGFFKLLVAQLQNQDMSNPMDNSEMMSQMTQIAMMQAMNKFSSSMDNSSVINTINYGTSMMGKKVMLSTADSSGNLKNITGTITRVDIYSGTPIIYIDDNSTTGYSVANIMSIYEEGHTPPVDLGETDPDTSTS